MNGSYKSNVACEEVLMATKATATRETNSFFIILIWFCEWCDVVSMKWTKAYEDGCGSPPSAEEQSECAEQQ